jgi:O6-methylguanine-DNA--protein-cysteine methyltransferase
MSEKLHLSTSTYCKIEYGETTTYKIIAAKVAKDRGVPQM